MSSAPFNLELVIARLKEAVPVLQKVEGAAEYAAILALKDFRPPCAYALPVREASDPDQPRGGRQRALVTFGVVVAVRNYRGNRGEEAVKTLDPIVGAVRGAMMGWTPDVQGSRPTKWIQGDVLDFDAGTLLWSEVYQTQMFIGPTTN